MTTPAVQATSEAAAGVTVYDEKFFSAYGVVTARDMLERIPGMAGLFAAGGQQVEAKRGLRSETDQVLINGKRNTGKNNNVSEYLDRIPATQVLRIEVIGGNVKEIDSAVSGRVVNVILRNDKASGSGTLVAGLIFISTGQVHPSGQLSYSIETGPWSATMGLETRARLQPLDVTDIITTPAGLKIGRLDEVRGRDRQEYTGRARFGYAFPTGENLQFSFFKFYFPITDRDVARRFNLTPSGPLPTTAQETLSEGHDGKFELTSDYVKPFGSSSKFLGLAVINSNTIVRASDVFTLFDFASKQTNSDSRNEKRTEKILRGTIQTDVTAKQQLEFGVEVAKTNLNKDLDFSGLDANGLLAKTEVANSDARITEDRVEVFSSYSWKPLGGVEIEPGVAGEVSWLNQKDRIIGGRRQFKFVKPSLNIWYNTTARNRTFFSFVRDVGQLAFEDFATGFVREDNEIVPGNPNLVPEKAWAFELGNEYRLANDAGLLQVKGIYKRVNDVNDRVLLKPPAGSKFTTLTSGPGNLGNGVSYGVRFEGSIKLSKLGLFDGVISGSYLLQDSEVTDAFTGKKRRFGKQPKYEATLNYRHDIQRWGMSYGIEYAHFGPFVESDFGRFDRRTTGGDARFFIEKQLGKGFVLRAFNGNAFRISNTRLRTLYGTTTGQASGVVTSVESRIEKPSHFFGFRLRSTF